MENNSELSFWKDYRFWFGLIALIISLVGLVISFRSQSISEQNNIDLINLKSDLIETNVLISSNATIEYIDGVKCMTMENGGKWCAV